MNNKKLKDRNGRSRRRQIFINRIFLIFFLIVLGLVIKNIWSLRSDKKNEDNFYNLIGTGNPSVEETEEPEEETKESTIVTNLGSEEENWKATVKNEVSSNSNAKIISEKFDTLPKDLQRMAGTNPDTIDFVAKYLDYSIKYKFDYPNKIYSDKKYPYYIQWDQEWGYQEYGTGIIGNAGCAPTSLAMMLSGMKNKKITPDQIAEIATKNGHTGDYGTNWDVYPFIGEKYGLEVTQVPNDLDSIIKQLDSGNPIIISVGPGTFTTVSHVMLIVGHDKNNKLEIYDPNNLQNAQKMWDLSTFKDEIRNMWAYSK